MPIALDPSIGPWRFAALVLAGLVAGMLNAAGGGGTFVALPALVAAGLPPATANASTTVALLPGSVASAWTYRRDVVPVGDTSQWALTLVSLVGGGLGAGLLLVLPAASFERAVPWLLAFATAVLALGRPASAWLLARLRRAPTIGPRVILVAQFALAIYGGYFGGAVGILMLALWSVALGIDAAAGNPMRVTQLAAVWTVAAVLFLIASDVLAEPAPVAAVLLGAGAGGLLGARLVRRLPARLLRGLVLGTAVAMTTYMFLGPVFLPG